MSKSEQYHRKSGKLHRYMDNLIMSIFDYLKRLQNKPSKNNEISRRREKVCQCGAKTSLVQDGDSDHYYCKYCLYNMAVSYKESFELLKEDHDHLEEKHIELIKKYNEEQKIETDNLEDRVLTDATRLVHNLNTRKNKKDIN